MVFACKAASCSAVQSARPYGKVVVNSVVARFDFPCHNGSSALLGVHDCCLPLPDVLTPPPPLAIDMQKPYSRAGWLDIADAICAAANLPSLRSICIDPMWLKDCLGEDKLALGVLPAPSAVARRCSFWKCTMQLGRIGSRH